MLSRRQADFTARVSPLFSRLRAVHVRIFAVQAHQLIVRALLGYAAVFDEYYHVRIADGGKPVRYYEGRSCLLYPSPRPRDCS